MLSQGLVPLPAPFAVLWFTGEGRQWSCQLFGPRSLSPKTNSLKILHSLDVKESLDLEIVGILIRDQVFVRSFFVALLVVGELRNSLCGPAFEVFLHKGHCQ
jgi:hypothetical protein